MIAMVITFRRHNKNSLGYKANTYQSSRKRNTLYIQQRLGGCSVSYGLVTLCTSYWCVYRIIVFTCVEMNSNIYFRPFRHGGKRTLYLVDTVAMVAQQASYIRHLTDLSVGEYASVDAVDVFDMEDWEQQFQGNQVDVTRFCVL